MNETNYIFSATLNGFLPLAWKSERESAGLWPHDAMPITYDDYLKYTSDPPEGMILGADGNGMPAWKERPTPPNNVILSGILSSLSVEYKNDIYDLNAAYLAAIVSDGPSEVTKQQSVRNQINERKSQYMADIAAAKEQYPI